MSSPTGLGISKQENKNRFPVRQGTILTNKVSNDKKYKVILSLSKDGKEKKKIEQFELEV